MKILHKDFDISKWKSYSQNIIQPYIHDLLKQNLDNPERCFYRGGFGKIDDYQRLLKTGSDYKSATISVDNKIYSATFASSFQKVGSEPWCRGFDPLYWALKGHPDKTKWNLINCIVAYSLKEVGVYSSDIIYFKSEKPSPKSIEAILVLNFDKN